MTKALKFDSSSTTTSSLFEDEDFLLPEDEDDLLLSLLPPPALFFTSLLTFSKEKSTIPSVVLPPEYSAGLDLLSPKYLIVGIPLI